ncbi:FxLYD domain-containing protein [Deinococcus aquaticus]|uniref:FxLYD domain-containing protein n=1 Tax=Deinococcus aquaticus TaxID=328692 RepID=UPI00361F6752
MSVDFNWRSDEYSRYLVGTVVNESDRVIHDVAVKFTLTDEDRNLVGDTTDYVDSIEPGQTWSFESYVTEDRASYARLSEVKGRAYEY